MGIACSLAKAIPVVGIILAFYFDYLIIYALLVQKIGVKNGFITINWPEIGEWILNNLVPEFLRGPIQGGIDFFNSIGDMLDPFKNKDGFVSQPLEYKKHLNNDGGIGWVPYYGKPGRKCKKDEGCPTFQKCKKEKCVIPLGVR